MLKTPTKDSKYNKERRSKIIVFVLGKSLTRYLLAQLPSLLIFDHSAYKIQKNTQTLSRGL